MPPPKKDAFSDACRRHYQDAADLCDTGRWDNAVYLAGYVVECALKASLERWLQHVGVAASFAHELEDLESVLLGDKEFDLLIALAPNPRPAQLIRRLANTLIVEGHPNRRYWKDGWTGTEARAVVSLAESILADSWLPDVLDGLAEA